MQILFFIVGVFLQWTLEVLGAGGAIWGMSEVWHMRGGSTSDPEGTNDDLRIPANIVFVLGFIRMFFRYSSDSALKSAIVGPQDWVANRGNEDASKGGMLFLEIIGFVLGFFLQWTLEVLGAGGATWGISEVWNLRNESYYCLVSEGGDGNCNPGGTNHTFRWVANVTFCVAIFRMAQKYCPPNPIHTAMLSPQDWIRSLQQGPKRTQDQEMEMTEMGTA